MRAPLLLAAFLLTSCGGSTSGPSDAAIYTVVQGDIKARLRDPSSAEFSDMRPIRNEGKVIGACGRVNSKNGFGGMSGPSRFIGGGNINAIEGDGTMDAANFEDAWRMMCGG